MISFLERKRDSYRPNSKKLTIYGILFLTHLREKRIFPSKFVLKIKRNSDRTIERYKATPVLLGQLQQEDVEFFEI
jgi:hypothetical protein